MIEVSVAPGDLIAKRRSPLSIKFTNTGRGACSNIVFKVRLPPGIVLRGGSDRIEIGVISAGRAHTHQITVEAVRPGRFEVTSTNFSYRDELDMPVRVNDFHASLRVTAAPPPVQIKQPVGRLGVACEGGELDLGAWDELRIMITNGTGVSLEDVTVAVEGPFIGDGSRSRLPMLHEGSTARFPFHVHATEGGRHVPISVRTTYSHRDASGVARTRTQEDRINVVVRPPASDQETAQAEQTVLYLTASPRDLPQLRSDLEMREVKEKLKRSKLRDRYRIESAFAARFDDISQALIDYEPHVIHFSGHGDKDGNLCIEDQNGNSDLITPEGLAELFAQHKSTVRCVLVNACYSQRLAEALAARIDYVIGMRNQIGDRAAIEFSVGFYVGLFGGMSVPQAFGRGRAHLMARPVLVQEHLTPLIFPPDAGDTA